MDAGIPPFRRSGISGDFQFFHSFSATGGRARTPCAPRRACAFAKAPAHKEDCPPCLFPLHHWRGTNQERNGRRFAVSCSRQKAQKAQYRSVFLVPFEPFCGKSREVLIQEPFARQTGVFPAKSGQTQSNPVKPFCYSDPCRSRLKGGTICDDMQGPGLRLSSKPGAICGKELATNGEKHSRAPISIFQTSRPLNDGRSTNNTL